MSCQMQRKAVPVTIYKQSSRRERERERERDRDRDRDRETDRQTDRDTERHRKRETETGTEREDVGEWKGGERNRTRTRKNMFYKAFSFGSVKNLSNYQSLLSY